MNIDVPKVRGKMAEKGYTLSSFAKRLDISRNTLSSYLDTPGKIPYSVLSDMAVILCDTSDEACQIFFGHNLRETKV